MHYPEYLEKLRAGEKGLNPFLEFLNIELTDLSDGRVCFKMPIRSDYMQGAKIMQGGMIVALADEAIAHAIMTQLAPDEGLTTIELKSNFLSGISHGELIAEATVYKKGKRLIIGDCIVSNEKGKKICRVSATFMLLRNQDH